MSILNTESLTAEVNDAVRMATGGKLSAAGLWRGLSQSSRGVWAEIAGSGKTPYRVAIDLQEMAFKCSCPSKQFPCKHGIGLAMLRIAYSGVFDAATEPDWVGDWLDKRRAKGVVEPTNALDIAAESLDNVASDKAKQKRADLRMQNVVDGVEELDSWLRDLMRAGLLSLLDKKKAWYEHTAARMIDAQAGGLARRVKELGKLDFYTNNDWQMKALRQCVELFALLEAFRRLEQYAPEQQADIRTLVGWTQDSKGLMNDATVASLADTWLILSSVTTLEDAVYAQQTWLYGVKTGKYALILTYTPKIKPEFEVWNVGGYCVATLVYFPSAFPQRALIKERTACAAVPSLETDALPNFAAANSVRNDALSRLFWLASLPQHVDNIRVVRVENDWFLVDAEGVTARVSSNAERKSLLALFVATNGGRGSVFVLQTPDGAVPIGYMEGTKYFVL